jgi:hypothetical protein
VSSVEPARQSPVRRRVVPALAVFVVAAGAIYATTWVCAFFCAIGDSFWVRGNPESRTKLIK